MKSLNIAQSFRNKNFRYGGYAALTIAIVLGILLVINLVAGQIPLKLDLSENQLYTLSKQTETILTDLKQPVTIYALYGAGKESSTIAEILGRYRDRSSKISIKYIDPDKNPGFVKQFAKDGQTLDTGSLIVVSGKRFKVINASDLVNYDYSNPYQEQVSSLAVEQRVTGAIQYVHLQKSPRIYLLKGHGEADLPQEVAKQLDTDNYVTQDLNLLTKPIPQDADILMELAPSYDLTAAEVSKIREFLARNGRAIFLPTFQPKELPNIQSLLSSYGVTLQPLIVVESDSSKYAGNPLFLLPEMADHQILNPLAQNQMPLMIPQAQSLKMLDIKKRTTTIEPLLTTTAAAWGKTDFNNTSLDRSPNEPSGPFNLALAITDKENPEATTGAKIVVVANAAFLSSQFVNQVPGNINFLMNSLNWLEDRGESLTIQPKSLMSFRLNMNAMQVLIYSALVVIVIPLIVLGTGVIVWLRRRHL